MPRVESREPEGDGSSAAPEGQHGGSAWPLIALLLLATAALLVIQMRRPRPADPLVGQPLPPLEAAGWLNTDRPLTAADLGGKIVVIDFWASWCGECFAGLPDLVEFQDRYRDQGVMVVGMTNEPPDKLPAIERFLGQVDGANWPNAYGAVLAHQVMNIEWLPTYVLYDRSGVSVWSGASVAELEDAVVELLAKERSQGSRVKSEESRARMFKSGELRVKNQRWASAFWLLTLDSKLLTFYCTTRSRM